jgi:hypothetical protein
MPFTDLRPPQDLYFLFSLGLLMFVGSCLSLLGDLRVAPASFAGPIVPVLALLGVGTLFLGGGLYVYWTRSRGGENPFRPRQDA